jgi:DNA-binding HxlR family transcriptional regulator
LLILRDAFLGIRRFEQWQQHLRIARQLLADRLRLLVAEGIVRRAQYEAHPPRYDYRLTAMGRDLYALALMIRRWERRWGTGVDAMVGEVTLLHRSCGKRTEPRCVCAKCGATVNADEITMERRSSVGLDANPMMRRRRRSSAISSKAARTGPFLHDAIDVLGDRWTYLVLIATFYGIRRFMELSESLGIATNILSDRLTRLIDAQILQHSTPNEHVDVHEYALTEKGADLFLVIIALMQWGERWFRGSHETRLIVRHLHCGSLLKARINCDHCGDVLRSLDVEYRWPRPDVRGRKHSRLERAIKTDASAEVANRRSRREVGKKSKAIPA